MEGSAGRPHRGAYSASKRQAKRPCPVKGATALSFTPRRKPSAAGLQPIRGRGAPDPRDPETFRDRGLSNAEGGPTVILDPTLGALIVNARPPLGVHTRVSERGVGRPDPWKVLRREGLRMGTQTRDPARGEHSKITGACVPSGVNSLLAEETAQVRRARTQAPIARHGPSPPLDALHPPQFWGSLGRYPCVC